MAVINMAMLALLLSCIAAVIHSLPLRVNSYGSPMRRSAYNGYNQYIPRLHDRESRSRYPVQDSYRDTYRTDDDDDDDSYRSDLSGYRSQTYNNQAMELKENELYSALEDWIMEKNSEERREEERGEEILRDYYEQEPSDEDGWVEDDDLSDSDTSSYYYNLLEKIFNRQSKPSDALNTFSQPQVHMHLRDLSVFDDQTEDEQELGGDNSNVIVQTKKPTGRPVLTVEKAKSLLAQLKKAEATKMNRHHDIEQIDKKSLNDLLAGAKDEVNSEGTIEQEQTTTDTENEDVGNTTPSIEIAEVNQSERSDLSSEEDNSDVSAMEIMVIKYKLIKEENDLLIEALDKLSKYPFEYYQSQEETKLIREILEQASVRQDTISYIDDKSEK